MGAWVRDDSSTVWIVLCFDDCVRPLTKQILTVTLQVVSPGEVITRVLYDFTAGEGELSLTENQVCMLRTVYEYTCLRSYSASLIK